MDKIENNLVPTSPEDIRTDADKILCLALDIGEGILCAGGEINRVENTIERICRAYGAKHVEVFTINSLIVADLRLKDNSYSTQIRRVLNEGTNLSRLERLNSLSRKICREVTPVDEALEAVKKTRAESPYPTLVSLFGASLGAAAFAVYFGGSWLDALAAGVIGLVLKLFDANRPSYLNKMASTVICSFIGGMLAYLMTMVGVGSKVDVIMMGTIMLLIPGAYFGYALRDLLFGDFLAGSLKLIQTFLVAGMIALGFGLSILLMGGIAI